MKLLIILLFVSFTAYDQKNIILDSDSTDVYGVYFKQKGLETKKTFESAGNKKFLNDFTQKFSSEFDAEKNYQELLKTNVDEWEMKLFDKRAEQLAFLKTKKDSISSTSFKFIENEILFNYWHLLFAYPVIRSNLDIKMKRLVSLPKVMTKSLKPSILDSDSLLSSKSFRLLLPFYITYRNSEERDYLKYSDMVQSTSDKAEYAVKNLKGNILDYSLAIILKANSDRVSSGTSRYITSQINNIELQNYFKGEYLTKVIDNEMLAQQKAKEVEKLKKEAKDKKDLVQLIDLQDKTFDFTKYKGKVVYVDFWASWCGPCRGEFPYSKKMHEELSEKDKQKIVFLYISIDDAAENWKNAVEKLGLKDFENGFSTGGWSSEVVRKYKITGIPRYMIIDKQGNIVKSDAKRPSNPETISDLLELAK
jgi:thiol-disulfide isomerase/thioredoxin